MREVVVDVREPDEYATGHVAGAINVPLGQISHGLPSGIGKDSKVVVYCNSGNRSGVAQQLLQQQGYKNVINGINQVHVEAAKE